MLSVTGLAYEPTDAMVTVFMAELPPPIVIAPELSVNEKSGVAVRVKTAWTKSPTLGVQPLLPRQAVTSITYCPGETFPTMKLPVKFPSVLPPPLTAQAAPVMIPPLLGLEREQLWSRLVTPLVTWPVISTSVPATPLLGLRSR